MGFVVLTLRNSETNEVQVIRRNLVVNNAYKQIAKLIGDGILFASAIAEISPGIGTTPVAASDMVITHPVVPPTPFPVTATFPETNYVKFHAEWAVGESLLENITELGLFFGGTGGLCSRVVFSAMTKSAIWLWEIDWTLYYNVSYV